MGKKKSTPPKRARAPRKKPKKKPAARAITFTYARGEETISTTSPKSGKAGGLATRMGKGETARERPGKGVAP
jgi:hypothetical protein